MLETEKLNLCFVKYEDGNYRRLDQHGNAMYFAGNPKFIVQALVKKFGPERGEQVFNDFMAGLETIKELECPPSRKKGPATFVLYHKEISDDDTRGLEGVVKKIQNREKEYSEDGEDFMT